MRRRSHPEGNVAADRWLISYADFITLLFAFFVVLFATAYRDNRSVKKISQAIHQGFQSMGAFGGDAQATADGPEASTPPQADRDQNPRRSAAEWNDLTDLRKQLEAAMGKELRDGEVVMRITPEGFVISLRELGFFNSGEAVLLPGAAEKIGRIAKVLMNHGLEIRIEGHSDDQPIHNKRFSSNWELSTSRAMAVLLFLVDESNLDPQRISVMGYGQYHPVADNSTAEGRRMNRRVDLIVVAQVPNSQGSRGDPPVGAAPQ